MKEDFVIFPGWFRSQNVYPEYRWINIWETDFENLSVPNTKYIVGHSIGSILALLKWKEKPKSILILFNPLILKRSRWKNFSLWLKMLFMPQKRVRGVSKLRYLPIGIKNAFRFIDTDISSILKQIPSDKLIIIRGKNDNLFCDDKTVDFMRLVGIPFHEIEEVGHSWDIRVSELIAKLIVN